MTNNQQLGTSNQPPTINQHIPVLMDEVMEGLQIGPGMKVIDCTLGGGGHCAQFLEHIAPTGKVLGIDADPQAIIRIQKRFPQAIADQRLSLIQSPYVALEKIVNQTPFENFQKVDAIFLDLGVSSFQLDSPERGFSFSYNGPLDMRMDPGQNLDAAQIVNHWSEHEIAHIIYIYGQEHQSRRIARAIVQQRPLKDTAHLAQIVSKAKGGRQQSKGKIHPATLTFQALRIAVNEELSQIEAVLPTCLALLKPGGRLGVISFHSLEDGIIKRWIRTESQEYISDPNHPYGGDEKESTLRIITRKPITPTSDELTKNPRSRSAKFRIAERL